LHYWVGSFCRITDKKQRASIFPAGATAVSDVIKIVADLGNQIPDKSWMLYLLELFTIRNVPIELNLSVSLTIRTTLKQYFKVSTDIGLQKYYQL